MIEHHSIPALHELQARPQWVCWRKEQRKDKWTKVPYDPRTGQMARSNDPTTWANYEQVRATCQQSPGRYDGIGYMFHRDFTGVDVDHCINEQGQIEPWAWDIITRLASYAEQSPSETGVHILVHGSVPKGIRRFISKQLHPRHAEAAIEMYCEGRYFTITGKHVQGTPTTIAANQDALDRLYVEITLSEPEATQTRPVADPPVSLDDEALLKKAMEARSGNKFRALFLHGATDYPSASEADMALCLMLAFWTGRDTQRMDRLFRRSALYREKWDTTRSSSTYGQGTIQKAAAICRVIYDPERSRHQLERDIEQVLHQVEGQQEKLNANKKSRPYQLTLKEVPVSRVLAYLEENEYGDARFFAEAFAGQVCYDHTDEKWYLWNGHHWKEDLTGKVRLLVAGVLGSLYLKTAAELNTTYAELGLKIQTMQDQGVSASRELEVLSGQYKTLAGQISELHTRVKALRGAKRNANVLRFIASEMGMTADIWDTNPWLLAVPNGVLDLHDGARRDGVSGDYIRTVSPTEWTGLDAACPRFEQFLGEIFADKEDRDDLIAFLHRLLGYSITGLTTLHIFPILYGKEGRNGKDTLLATLNAVLGPLVGAVSNDVFLAQDKSRAAGAASPHLVDLQGKRLAWGSETKEGDRLNIAQIKHLTGGGDISARQLHGHQYKFSPTHKLVLITNYKPHAEARDKAFWSRACLIEFGLRFIEDPKEANERQVDLTLKESLQQERSGILAWLVRGCLEWQRTGLRIPPSVQLATGKYRDEEDRLLQFVQECCVIRPEVYVKAQALFNAYRAWYEENQFGGRGINGKLFGDEMSRRFAKKITKNGRFYQGIGLLSPDPGNGQQALFNEEVMEGDGSVMGRASPITSTQSASEANPHCIDELIGDGCDGLRHVFAKNEQKIPPGEEKHGNMHHTHHRSLSVTITHPPSEADAGHNVEPEEMHHHSSPDAPSRSCTTRYEKRHQVAHEAVAAHFSAGCYWCEKCEPQRVWMEFGEAKNYPHIDVPAHRFQVGQGRANWLQFAQEAGYTLVQYALEAARQRDSFEL